MLADTRVCVGLNLTLVDCPTKMDQPLTEEKGKGLPLPTFHPCKGPIVVVDSSLDEGLSSHFHLWGYGSFAITLNIGMFFFRN